MSARTRPAGKRAFAAAAAGTVLATAGAAIAAGDALPLRCRFDDGLRAIYIIDRASWSARRPDVRPTRVATLDVTADAYRLAFRPGGGRYRIAVEIDRRDGRAHRIFGRDPPASADARHVVEERGRCRARFGTLGDPAPARAERP